MKTIKLKKLQEIYERGIITTEEYEKKKREIEEIPEEKMEEAKEEAKDTRTTSGTNSVGVELKSDRTIIIGATVIVLLFASIIFAAKFLNQERPQTIDEMHELNFKGKLKKDQGYLYDGVYSFVKFENLWYTQLVSPKGTRLYNIQFRYSPKEVESIETIGQLNLDFFNNASEYYVTFTPHEGNNFSGMVVAIGDFNQQMGAIFFKQPIPACDRNETRVCADRPIITCDNTDKVVLYMKESDSPKIVYKDNCIVVEGNGLELVKGIDRVLYELYGIMKQ